MKFFSQMLDALVVMIVAHRTINAIKAKATVTRTTTVKVCYCVVTTTVEVHPFFHPAMDGMHTTTVVTIPFHPPIPPSK